VGRPRTPPLCWGLLWWPEAAPRGSNPRRVPASGDALGYLGINVAPDKFADVIREALPVTGGFDSGAAFEFLAAADVDVFGIIPIGGCRLCQLEHL